MRFDLPLLEFIPELSPEFKSPYHLKEWTDVFERVAAGESGVRALNEVPIRHYKTQTTLHGIVWLLGRFPTRRWLLLTHSHQRAVAVGKRLMQLATSAGVGPVRGTATIEDWANEKGGGAVVMSAEQSKLGYDVHGLIFDDPIDEHGSIDPKVRDAVDETIAHYTARCQFQGLPGPVMGVASPWHPDGPVGRRLIRTAVHWTHVRKSAIQTRCHACEGIFNAELTECPACKSDDVTPQAFAPEVWSLDALRQMRKEEAERDPTERIWEAQLMCDPRPVGLSKFKVGSQSTFDVADDGSYRLPDWSFRLAYGVDLAYTSGENSDYFALVVGKVYGKKLYVLDVQRHKLDAHLIESVSRRAIAAHGIAPFFTYVSGPEVGMVRVMRERGLQYMPMRARYNKLVRAERTIRRWNDGDIVLPKRAPWLSGFLHRVELFQGLDKARDDDEIDALVSLADGALGGAVAGSVKTMGRSYSGFGLT